MPALAAQLAPLPEYRQARERPPPLLALLLPVCVAMLCGARSPSASADGGRGAGRPWRRLFGRLPYKTVAAALGRWAEQAPRGSKRQGAADARPPAAFSHRRGGVPGQPGVPGTPNAIGAARAFLLGPALEGRGGTADALLTQREIARTIRAGGGDYPLGVTANRSARHDDLVAAPARPVFVGLGGAGRHHRHAARRPWRVPPAGRLHRARRRQRLAGPPAGPPARAPRAPQAQRAPAAPGDGPGRALGPPATGHAAAAPGALAAAVGAREPAPRQPRRPVRRGSRHRPRRPRAAGAGRLPHRRATG